MASRGRVSPGASASNSPSTRSAQSAAHTATIRRSASLSVCGEPTPRFSQGDLSASTSFQSSAGIQTANPSGAPRGYEGPLAVIMVGLWALRSGHRSSLDRWHGPARLPHEGDIAALTHYATTGGSAGVGCPSSHAPPAKGWSGHRRLAARLGREREPQRTSAPGRVNTASWFVGLVGFGARDHDFVELFYGIAPDWRGRGLATRATTLATSWLIAEQRARAVELRVGRAHRESQRVAEKAGFGSRTARQHLVATTKRSRTFATSTPRTAVNPGSVIAPEHGLCESRLPTRASQQRRETCPRVSVILVRPVRAHALRAKGRCRRPGSRDLICRC